MGLALELMQLPGHNWLRVNKAFFVVLHHAVMSPSRPLYCMVLKQAVHGTEGCLVNVPLCEVRRLI